jgi:hypothetical protein
LTPLHEDPALGTHAWMYLSEGNKIWWFIHGDDIEYLKRNNIDIYSLGNFSFT